MKNKVLAIALALIMAVSTAQPALAKEFTLTIHNNTEENIKVTLEGPENYSFTVVPGWNYKAVEEGTYEYKLAGCTATPNGEIEVTSENVLLEIEQCPPETLYAKIAVNAHISGITLTLSGPEEYSLPLELGRNRFPQLVVGSYLYSYDACGETLGGEIRITKNGKTELTLKSCEKLNYFSFGVTGPTNLRIGSHYAFPVNVTLVGEQGQSYFKTISPGLNRLDVINGTYYYYYTAYGVTKDGSFTINDNGLAFVISPLK